MKHFILEACIDSAESAINAEAGGANRFELCANLIIGGTTPTPSLFKEVAKNCSTKINVLIRPRFGDFCYTDLEFNQIKEDVKQFQKLGANGIVIGILKADGTLDFDRMKELVVLADGMEVTLHRAFDMCTNPMEALDRAQEIGIHTILTSGQQNVCTDGLDLISQLIGQNKVNILVGSGVTAENVALIHEKTGATNYHTSCKETLNSDMIYRNPHVFMGLDGISEYSIYRTSESKMREVYDNLNKIRE